MRKYLLLVLIVLLAGFLRSYQLGIVPVGVTNDELGYIYNNFNGLIEVLVPPGKHMITAEFLDTPVRNMSNVISLGSLILLPILSVF